MSAAIAVQNNDNDDNNTTAAAASTLAANDDDQNGIVVVARQEKVLREQQASLYFRKGTEAASVSNNFKDQYKAIENFSIAISLRPDQCRFFASRANSFRIVGEYDAAIEDYTMALSYDLKNPAFYSSRGLCYRKKGHIVEALENFTHAIEFDSQGHQHSSGSGDARRSNHFINRAMVLVDDGFYNEAIIDYTKAIEIVEASKAAATSSKGRSVVCYRAYVGRGNCHKKLLRFDAAAEDFQSAIAFDQSNASAHVLLGNTYVDLRRYDDAIASYSIAISITPDSAAFYNFRGMAYYQKKSNSSSSAQKAFNDFHRAVSLVGSEGLYYFNRGNARLVVANKAKSAASRDDSVDINNKPNTVTIMTPREQILAAIEDYGVANDLSPNNLAYIHGTGMAYEALGTNYDVALEHFLHALKINPNHLDSIYHAGLMQYFLGDLDAAKTSFSTGIAAIITDANNDPDVSVTASCFYQALAMVEQSLNEHSSALGNFKLAKNKDDAYLVGESLLRTGRFEPAIAAFSAAAAMSSDVVSTIYNARGIAYKVNNEFEASIADFTKALEFSKNAIHSGIICLNRGSTYLEAQQFEQAESDLIQAQACDPTNGKIHYYHGLAFYHQSLFAECQKQFKNAIRLSDAESAQYYGDIFYYLGLSCANEGRYTEAASHITKAIEHCEAHKEATMINTVLTYKHERANCYQMIQQYSHALADFNAVIESNPNNAHAFFRRAFLHKNMGNFIASAEDFERAKTLDPTNPNLVVNYKNLHDTEVVILCRAGDEPVY